MSLHLPKSIESKLPFGTAVSAFYFHGNNETPKVRYAFDSSLLPSETGKTDDYGIEVDTLNGHATLRLTYFKTLDDNAQAGSVRRIPSGTTATTCTCCRHGVRPMLQPAECSWPA